MKESVFQKPSSFVSHRKLVTPLLLLIFSTTLILYGLNSNSIAQANTNNVDSITPAQSKLLPAALPALQMSTITYNFDSTSSSNCPTGWSSYCDNVVNNIDSNILRLSGQTVTLGLHSSFQNQDGIYEVKISFYDDGTPFYVALDETSNTTTGNVVALGIRSQQDSEYYYALSKNGIVSTIRTGYTRTLNVTHTLAIRVTPYGTYGVLDGISLSFLPSTNGDLNIGGVHRLQKKAYQLRIGQVWGTGTVRFDDLVIREHPTSTLYKQFVNNTIGPASIEKYFATLLATSTNPQASTFYNKILPDWERGKAQAALIYAFAHKKVNGGSCTSFSNKAQIITPTVSASNCDKARYFIRSMMDGVNNTDPKLRTGRFVWRQKWISGATAYSLALALSFIHVDITKSEEGLFPQEDRTIQWALTVLDQEADFWTNRLTLIKNNDSNLDPARDAECTTPASCFSRYKGNSSTEDQGTVAMFLQLWSQLRVTNLLTQTTTTRWVTPAKVYAFHTLTAGAFGEKDTLYELTSRTLNSRINYYLPLGVNNPPHNFIDNHNFSPSLNYSFAIAVPASVEPAGSIMNDNSYFMHNQIAQWQETKNYYSSSNFLYTPPSYFCTWNNDRSSCLTSSSNVFAITGRGDWGDDVTWFNNAFAFATQYAITYGNPSVETPLYKNLLKLELALRPDYLAYPIASGITLYKPENSTFGTGYHGKNLIDVNIEQGMLAFSAQVAERHIVSYLINCGISVISNPDLNCLSSSSSRGVDADKTIFLPIIVRK